MKKDSKEIENFIKRELINSYIGDAIYKCIKDMCELNSYRNPIINQIEKVVRELITKIIDEKYKDDLEQRINAQLSSILTDEIKDNIISDGLESFLEKLEK